jgi:dihydrofolate reductase
MFRLSMQPMSMIVAVDLDGGFAKDGKIPWNIPEDLKHFKEVTSGGVCIMGRHTYEDMLEMKKQRTGKELVGEILPGRQSFVVSRTPRYSTTGATVVPNIRKAVQSLDGEDEREVFVIGGYRLFIEAFAWVDKVHLTVINDRFDCDRFFPVKFLSKGFKIVDGETKDNLCFLTYQRG